MGVKVGVKVPWSSCRRYERSGWMCVFVIGHRKHIVPAYCPLSPYWTMTQHCPLPGIGSIIEVPVCTVVLPATCI